MTEGARVRYAPSPTGDPHVGNIRTALFNWLYAHHTGGQFILRIEDTDQARIAPGALESIMESLEWLGLEWDEGPGVGGPHAPYTQSERHATGIYGDAADRLTAAGDAYYCYCTPEELTEMRQEQQRLKKPPRYDGRCHQLTEYDHRAREGTRRVVRFAMPTDGPPIVVNDIIRGEVYFDPSVLDDFILLKSDGFPTYHLANAVDDHLMEISHVLRADEWLSSTPKHLLLYRALGYEPPHFCHLPLILGPDRARLAKRHGATSVLDYRDTGYLPEVMVNFLALLGWSLDDKTEIISRDELVRHFSLERVGKSPSIFDQDKLSWMSGIYLRQMPETELAQRLSEAVNAYLKGHPTPVHSEPTAEGLRTLVPLLQERLKTFAPDEVWELCEPFLVETPKYNESQLIQKGMNMQGTHEALTAVAYAIGAATPFDADTLEGVLRPLAEELQLKTRELFGAIRVAVTGRTASPPLFDTLAVLGKERVLARLGHVVTILKE